VTVILGRGRVFLNFPNKIDISLVILLISGSLKVMIFKICKAEIHLISLLIFLLFTFQKTQLEKLSNKETVPELNWVAIIHVEF
jgi:hypothetical protein